MSISILNRGASGGMTASIIVNGLSENDTVTASNGSKTKNAVWTNNVPLPEGYTQVEYIQSTGTQYIDTGFKPNSNTRLVADMEITAGSTSFLFGARNNSVNYGIMFVGFALAGYFGPQIMSSIYGQTGQYQNAFLIACGLNVVGVILTFIYRKIKK